MSRKDDLEQVTAESNVLIREYQTVIRNSERPEEKEAYDNCPDEAENVLVPVGRQIAWPHEIGFRDGDCSFKVLELALFGGREPGS